MGSNEGNHTKVVPVEITDTIYIALLKLSEMQNNLTLFFRDSELWASGAVAIKGA